MKHIRIVELCMLLVISLPSLSSSQLNLAAWVQSQSPDHKLIELNGVITSSPSNVLGWTYDWGDGERTTGYFLIFHRYQHPGTYDLTVTGYTDQSETKSVTFTHHVPHESLTPVKQVILSEQYVALKTGETAYVDITALDEFDNPLPPYNRSMEFYNPGDDYLDVQIQDSQLVITGKNLGTRHSALASVYVFVDKVESHNPLTVIVNKNTGTFDSVWGNCTGAYMPTTFFTSSNISENEFINIVDWAVQYDRWSVRGKGPDPGDPPVFQGISYNPTVYGCSGNPIGLGNAAWPYDGGVPHFDVIFHEIGHNFHNTNIFFAKIGTPGPFYQETLAEWYVQFGLHQILTEHASELSATALTDLTKVQQDNWNMHHQKYLDYLSNGKIFDYNSVENGSHPLVYKIYTYSESYGWEKLRNFSDLFDFPRMPYYAQLFAAHGGFTTQNRVTFFLAALSFSFGFDVRPEFIDLNFPLNDPFYNQLMALFPIEVIPVTITQPPRAQTVHPGQTVSFSITTTGSLPITYQWKKDGLTLAGETDTTLILQNVQPSDTGFYTCAVSNPVRTITSDAALLRFIPAAANTWMTYY